MGETKDKYASFGITHSRTIGKKHRNHLLKKNPNPDDLDKSYITKDVKVLNKKNYVKSDKYSKYKMSDEDDEYVDNQISKFQKRNKK